MWAVVHEGKIELLEDVDLPEGGKLLVTLLPADEDSQFWLEASQSSLDAVWDNVEDDIYTIHADLIVKRIGKLSQGDRAQLKKSL